MYATPTFKKDVALKPPTPSNKLLRREDGVAMLTVLMLTIILTVIGIAAITTTSLDMRMAGSERMRENSLSAAEACMSSGVQIIQQNAPEGAPVTLQTIDLSKMSGSVNVYHPVPTNFTFPLPILVP